MTVMVYAAAIRDAITRGDLRDMRVLLTQAKRVQKEHGNLPAAIKRLEKAITKLAAKKPRRS